MKINILITLLVLPFLASCKKEAKPSETGPKVTLISINKKEAEITMFDELHLEATAHPVAQNFKINWKSEDESIATVNAEGVVRGVKLGTVKIIASVAGSDKTAECKVTVCTASLLVHLDTNDLLLCVDKSYKLKISFNPAPTTNVNLKWSIDEESIAEVDSYGKVKAKKVGEAMIRVEVDDPFYDNAWTECKLLVTYNYDGYGPGIKIGDYVWAPLNCGYEPANHIYKGYTLGKYYQWGRKAGHGVALENGTLIDATAPKNLKGPVTYEESLENPNHFITIKYPYIYNWLKDASNYENLWNSGTEDNPIKTENDPCPEGWRVPTEKELRNLCKFYSGTSDTYNKFYDAKRKNKLLLPVTYELNSFTGLGLRKDNTTYWSSSYKAVLLNYFIHNTDFHAFGQPIRCVQE